MSISDLVSKLRGAAKAPVTRIPVTPLEKAHASIDAYLSGGPTGNLRELLKSCYANGPLEQPGDGPMRKLMLDAARGNRAARNLLVAIAPEFAENVEEEFEAAEKELLERKEYAAAGYVKERRLAIATQTPHRNVSSESIEAVASEAEVAGTGESESDTDPAQQEKILAPAAHAPLAFLGIESPASPAEVERLQRSVPAVYPEDGDTSEVVREEQNAEREIAAHVVAAEQESAEAKQAARLKGLAEASPGEFAAALEKDDYGTSLAENLLFRASYIGEAEHGALRGRQAQELLLKLIPRFAEHYSEVRPAIEEHLALARGAAKLLPDQYTAEPIDAFAKILAKTVVESRIGAVLSTRGTPTAAEQRLQQQSGAMMR